VAACEPAWRVTNTRQIQLRNFNSIAALLEPATAAPSCAVDSNLLTILETLAADRSRVLYAFGVSSAALVTMMLAVFFTYP
jgi:hypothetical protein